MRRIALLGNGGGGKSTAARRLSEALGLPLFSVDMVQWRPGWEREDLQVVAEWHAQILQQPAWIIDGWGSWDLIDDRLRLADTIILIDLPLEEHLAGARVRSERSLAGHAMDAPAGCNYHDVDELMETTLRYVDSELMPTLRAKIAQYGGHVFRSRASLDAAIADWTRPS